MKKFTCFLAKASGITTIILSWCLVFVQAEVIIKDVVHNKREEDLKFGNDIPESEFYKIKKNVLYDQVEMHLSKEQVQLLIDKEFGALFLVDSLHIFPTYLIGDFNNDGVNDIAVLARPRKTIAVNDKTKPPFWLDEPITGGASKLPLKDKQKTTDRDAKQEVRLPHEVFTIGDLARYGKVPLPVIVIIHGVKGRIWKDSEPQQKFVVLGGIGFSDDSMKLYRGKLKSLPIGDSAGGIPPKLEGDAILFTYRNDGGTVVYWEKGNYYWYPYKP